MSILLIVCKLCLNVSFILHLHIQFKGVSIMERRYVNHKIQHHNHIFIQDFDFLVFWAHYILCFSNFLLQDIDFVNCIELFRFTLFRKMYKNEFWHNLSFWLIYAVFEHFLRVFKMNNYTLFCKFVIAIFIERVFFAT